MGKGVAALVVAMMGMVVTVVVTAVAVGAAGAINGESNVCIHRRVARVYQFWKQEYSSTVAFASCKVDASMIVIFPALL